MIDLAVSQLDRVLPSSMSVTRSERAVPGPAGQLQQLDGMVEVRAQNGATTLVVEAKTTLTPRDAQTILTGQIENLASMVGARFLVVAPWLSPRSRELLAARGLNYVDLTGNTLISLDQPPIYVRIDGASRDPSPPTRTDARLRGAKAGRLVRFLIDVQPPYGVRELATASDLTPGYVSRLLDSLYRSALVERDDRGRVESVDIPRLLRQYGQWYDTFKTNDATFYIATTSATSALARLGDLSTRTAVTGSFAANRVAPVAAPSLLSLYCDNPPSVVQELGLLPADEGANVALLRPFDPVVWLDTVTPSDTGTSYCAPSQVALDCLSGNGRMPAEGDAVLEWMIDNEPVWRRQTLPASPALGAPA